ncbi:MAG: hypothetical protein ACIAS6_10675 [Phycisphaerales bacterium JB060]
MKKWVVLGLIAMLLATAGIGFWRWRAAMAPVTRTEYAARLHEHILSAQRDRWPDATDQWDDLAWELANVRDARGAMGDNAEILRSFDIGNSRTDNLSALESAVHEARSYGLFESAKRIADIKIAVRPYNELGPEDVLVGVMFDELSEVRFLTRAQIARAYIASRNDAKATNEVYAALDESLTLARLLSWQASTLEYLNARIVGVDMLGGLRAILSIEPVRDDALLRAIDERIERFHGRFAPASHVIQGDRLTTLDSQHRMHTVGGYLDRRGSHEWDGVMNSLGFDGTLYRGPLKDSLGWLDRFVEAAGTSARARGLEILEADAALESVHSAFIDLGDGPGERWPALMITLGEYSQPIAWERHMRIIAAGTRVSIAIERHRLAHGTLPESLDQLGDLLPEDHTVDPVTEQPWAYERTSDGYTLSSRALPSYEAGEDASEDPLAGIQIVP